MPTLRPQCLPKLQGSPSPPMGCGPAFPRVSDRPPPIQAYLYTSVLGAPALCRTQYQAPSVQGGEKCAFSQEKDQCDVRDVSKDGKQSCCHNSSHMGLPSVPCTLSGLPAFAFSPPPADPEGLTFHTQLPCPFLLKPPPRASEKQLACS